ncbi:MAG: PD-(D/E)XK nuclease family protein [Aliidongia sp.]
MDADPGVAERGVFIHKALDGFVARWPDALPPDAFNILLEIGRAAFGEALARPGVWAFWWPRFERIARLVRRDRSQSAGAAAAQLDRTIGPHAAARPGRRLRTDAKADRIDLFEDAGLAVIDYKTGRLPSKDEVGLGFAPQLPLEAAMAAEGGFDDVPATPGRGAQFLAARRRRPGRRDRRRRRRPGRDRRCRRATD